MIATQAKAPQPIPAPRVARLLDAARRLGPAAALREKILLYGWSEAARGDAPTARRAATRFNIPFAAAKAHVVALIAERLWPAGDPGPPPGPALPGEEDEDEDEDDDSRDAGRYVPTEKAIARACAKLRARKLADYARKGGGTPGPSVRAARAAAGFVVWGLRNDKRIGGRS